MSPLLNVLWRSSWQGAIVIGVVWCVCRMFERRLPASIRCTLWRLTYLKLLLGLAVAGVVALPLLPSATEPATAPDETPVPVLHRTYTEENTPRLPGTTVVSPSSSDTASPETTTLPAFRPTGQMLLAAPYLLGLAFYLIRLARAANRTRRILRNATPIDDDACEAMGAALAARLGVHPTPRIALAAELPSPAYIARTILLPATTDYTPDALRLILAHELAHARRRDLVYEWLGALTQALFYFHPLVYLARREERLARESAADALALQATTAKAADFGALLLSIATQPRPAPSLTGAIGVFEGGGLLHRRLRALGNPSAKITRRGAFLVFGGMAVVLTPYRMTSAHSSSPRVPPVPPVSLDYRSPGFPLGNQSIVGRVRDKNGHPVGGVQIEAILNTGDHYCIVGVDANGDYAITRLPAGSYNIAMNNEFTDETPPAPPHFWYDGEEIETTLKPDEKTLRVDFTASRGVTIAGRITDAAGAPVAGAKVTGWSTNDQGPNPTLRPFIAQDAAVTNAAGRYTLSLNRGFVYASVVAPDNLSLTAQTKPVFRNVAHSDGQSVNGDMALTNSALAALPAASPTSTPLRDYRPTNFPGGDKSIVGHVRSSETGNDAANVEVWVQSDKKNGFGNDTYSLSTHSDASGNFAVPRLAAGRYHVSINLNPWFDVTLAPKDTVKTVHLSYTRPVTISGRVTNKANGLPEANLSIQGAPYHSKSGDWTETARTDAAGRYTIELQPGDLFLTPYPNWDRYNGTGKVIHVAPGQKATLNFAVDDTEAHRPVR